MNPTQQQHLQMQQRGPMMFPPHINGSGIPQGGPNRGPNNNQGLQQGQQAAMAMQGQGMGHMGGQGPPGMINSMMNMNMMPQTMHFLPPPHYMGPEQNLMYRQPQSNYMPPQAMNQMRPSNGLSGPGQPNGMPIQMPQMPLMQYQMGGVQNHSKSGNSTTGGPDQQVLMTSFGMKFTHDC